MKRLLPFLPFLFAGAAAAQLQISPLFADHSVLQRSRPVPIWGTTSPGQQFSVSFNHEEIRGVADDKGNWRVELPAMAAGGPYELKVVGPNKVTVHDVMVGEVWLASGQSNMEIGLGIAKNYPQELAAADHPLLRIFTVTRNPQADPTDTLQGTWVVSTPENAKNFSATPYFFGSTLQAALHVPVGIINSSVGNTPAEAWTPLPMLDKDPRWAMIADKQIAEMRSFVGVDQIGKALLAWEKQYDAADAGNTGFAQGFATGAAAAPDWKTITIPVDGNGLGIKGAASIWIRREVTLPDRPYDQPATLDLGPMREEDTVYFDGVKVGEAPSGPMPYDRNAVYPIPASMLKAGPHTIAIRVFSHQPTRLYLGSRLSNFTIPDSKSGHDGVKLVLPGEWSYRLEHEGPALTSAAKQSEPVTIMRSIGVGSALYNGMIHPLRDDAIRGVIWYQGENNAGRADEYPDLMKSMIGSWRTQFKQPDLPFYLVQLPNFGQPWSTGWDNMREKQQQLVNSTPNMGMAVTIDIGESDNIHPHNKRPVGERLASLALRRVYKEPIEDTGPTYVGMSVEGSSIRIRLADAVGLKAVGGPIRNMAIAGADKVFHPATAKIDGTTLLISSPDVPQPVAVRYARTQDPVGCNVYNSADLPMPPFRTDDWEISKR
jgi:sialate O-acetylesterase